MARPHKILGEEQDQLGETMMKTWEMENKKTRQEVH